MKKTLIFISIIAFAVVGLFIWRNYAKVTPIQITNFADCVRMGESVMESYPRQCAYKGKTFTEDIGNELAKQNLIVIDNPRPNQRVSSPLLITGRARGNWYFEASFPIKIVDANGLQLGIVPAQAIGDWMTTEFVPFTTTLTFTTPTTATGTLILQKDNPSGLPEHDDALEIPIVFDML